MDKINLYRELKDFNILFYKNWDTKRHCSFKIGGTIRALIEVKKISQVIDVMRILRARGYRYYVIGNLTNVLIKDGKLDIFFIRLKGDFEKVFYRYPNMVFAGAGVLIDKLLDIAIKNGIGGIEFLSGIPGTIGGAIYMNAGAYGKYIGDIVENILVVDRKGKFRIVAGKNIFSYRNSIFQKDKSVILGAELNVFPSNSKKIKNKIKEILELRRAKHPWKVACAGSFFKNTKKFPAGMLIEDAGLKGARVGDAVVSKMHGNFIINTKNATFKDVMLLSNKIKDKIYKKYKIKLKEEVVIIS